MSKKSIKKIRCDACPVLCFIAEGKTGACDRYANEQGNLLRVDPLTIVENCDAMTWDEIGDVEKCLELVR